MKAKKIYISESLSRDRSAAGMISEYLRRSFQDGVELVYPKLPWTADSVQEMLACDVLIIIPPKDGDYSESTLVGVGQYDAALQFFDHKQKHGNTKNRVWIVNEFGEYNTVVSEFTGTATENKKDDRNWKISYGWLETDACNISIETAMEDYCDVVVEFKNDAATVGKPGSWVVFAKEYGGWDKGTISQIIYDEDVHWPIIACVHKFNGTSMPCRLAILREGVCFKTFEEANEYSLNIQGLKPTTPAPSLKPDTSISFIREPLKPKPKFHLACIRLLR